MRISHQLISFILMVQKRLFQGPAHIRVGRVSLEVGSSKLYKLVLWQVLMFLIGTRKSLNCLLFRLFVDILLILSHTNKYNTGNDVMIFYQLFLIELTTKQFYLPSMYSTYNIVSDMKGNTVVLSHQYLQNHIKCVQYIYIYICF